MAAALEAGGLVLPKEKGKSHASLLMHSFGKERGKGSSPSKSSGGWGLSKPKKKKRVGGREGRKYLFNQQLFSALKKKKEKVRKMIVLPSLLAASLCRDAGSAGLGLGAVPARQRLGLPVRGEGAEVPAAGARWQGPCPWPSTSS